MAGDPDELYAALLRGALQLYSAKRGFIALPSLGRLLSLGSELDSPAGWSVDTSLIGADAGSLLDKLDLPSATSLLIEGPDDQGAMALIAIDVARSTGETASEDTSRMAPLVGMARTLLRTFRVRADAQHAASERNAAELALRDVEAFFEEAQRISRTGSWIWDPTDPGSGEWSAQTYAMLGYDPVTTPASFEANVARIHPDDRARYLEVAQATVARGCDLDVEYRYLLPDGAVRHVHARGKRISSNLYIGTANDITERRTAEAAIRKAHAELAAASRLTTLGELVASLTHELNQPFTAAVANAAAARRWLARKPSELVRTAHSIEALLSDARRAKAIIGSLRAMARKSEPERRPVDIDEAALEVAALARSELDMQGAELRLDLRAGSTPVLVDRVQLQQVILTLLMACLERADKHLDGAKLIAMRTSWANPDTLVIAIEGFAPELMLPSSLDAPSNLRDAQAGGHVLVLSVCQSIIEAHQGSLRVVDGRLPASRFEIELPRAALQW